MSDFETAPDEDHEDLPLLKGQVLAFDKMVRKLAEEQSWALKQTIGICMAWSTLTADHYHLGQPELFLDHEAFTESGERKAQAR